jgi:hypothetical protein
MAKISLRVFKKGKPIFWIIGAVLIFVIFYLLFNKGGSAAPASSGGGLVVQNSGPSEAMQIAAMQAGAQTQALQMQGAVEAARIAATRDQAALAGQVALAQLGSGEKIALATLDADRFAAGLNAQTNLLINEQNLSYNLESARVAGETQLNLRALDVGVMTKQMETQAAMFGMQLVANQEMYKVQSHNLITQAAIGQVSNLKKKNRDEALTAIYSSATGTPNTYVPQSGGGFGFGDIFGVISPLAGAIA